MLGLIFSDEYSKGNVPYMIARISDSRIIK
jgi:hypothetical protein